MRKEEYMILSREVTWRLLMSSLITISVALLIDLSCEDPSLIKLGVKVSGSSLITLN